MTNTIGFSQATSGKNILNIAVRSEGEIDITCTIKVQKKLADGLWETLKTYHFAGDGFHTIYYGLQIGTVYRVVVEAEDRKGNYMRTNGQAITYTGNEINTFFTFDFTRAKMYPLFLA